MLTRRLVLTAVVVAATAAIAASSTHAGSMLTRVNRLTFSAPVALPGVVLAPGTYAFESGPLGTNPAIVRVTSADHRRLLYQGFTISVRRPMTMERSEVLQLGEAPKGSPQPIAAWYPIGNNTGHRFIYE